MMNSSGYEIIDWFVREQNKQGYKVDEDKIGWLWLEEFSNNIDEVFNLFRKGEIEIIYYNRDALREEDKYIELEDVNVEYFECDDDLEFLKKQDINNFFVLLEVKRELMDNEDDDE